MKISEILKKISEGKELSDVEKEFAKSYVEPKGDDGKAAQLQQELEQLKTEKADLQKKIDEAENAKLSDVEKLTKQVNALNTQIANLTKERDELKTANAGMAFDHGVEKLAREYKFTDVDFLKFKIQGAKLDITKADKVAEFMGNLKKDSPKFFEAEVNHGGGGTPPNPEGGDGGGTDKKARLAEIMKKENPSALELAEAMKLSDEIKAESVDGQQDNNN